MASRLSALFPSNQAIIGLLLGIFVPLVLAGFVNIGFGGGLSDKPARPPQSYIIE